MASYIDLNDLPHHEAKRLLSTGAPAFVFVNPVEYHGPHLPLHNDGLIAKGLASDLHARLFADAGHPFLVGGDLEMGVDPCPGPGTRAFSYEAVSAAMVDVCNGLVDLGARAIIAMTFHGSPLHEHAIEAGLAAARRRGARVINPMNLLLDLLVKVDGRRFAPSVAHVDDENERFAILDNIPNDFHGGFFETSMTMHYAPASVSPSHVDLAPCPTLPSHPVWVRLARAARLMGRTRLADELDLAARSQGWGSLRPFPGYTGAPHRASSASGKYFASQVVDLYAEPVRKVVVDGADDVALSPPIMPWVLWMTLKGRIEAANEVRLEDVLRAPAVTTSTNTASTSNNGSRKAQSSTARSAVESRH